MGNEQGADDRYDEDDDGYYEEDGYDDSGAPSDRTMAGEKRLRYDSQSPEALLESAIKWRAAYGEHVRVERVGGAAAHGGHHAAVVVFDCRVKHAPPTGNVAARQDSVEHFSRLQIESTQPWGLILIPA